MLNVIFSGEEKFLFGLQELAEQLCVNVQAGSAGDFCGKDGGFLIESERAEGKETVVTIEKRGAKISYAADCAFFKAFSLAVQYSSCEGKTMRFQNRVERLGSMQDCSDSLLNVECLKETIRQSALLGYTYLAMYIEATYEVEGEPYFGYKAGKYSKAELGEIVAYGEKFGVEIMPFIQTLGHFAQIFKWDRYYGMSDIANTLLVEYEETYEFLDKIIKSVSEAFHTDRINLGMDEAYFMGYGRYNWFVNPNKPDTTVLFAKHCARVVEIAKKYGFSKPEIWHDNLFEIAYKGYIVPPEGEYKGFSAETIKNFPKVRLRVWNYNSKTIENFDKSIELCTDLSSDRSFASQIKGFTSFAPADDLTETVQQASVDGCVKNGFDDLVVTSWEAKKSPLASLLGYFGFAVKNTAAFGYDEADRFEFLYGYTKEEYAKLALPNQISFGEKSDAGHVDGERNPDEYILADDLLMSLAYRHIPRQGEEYYAAAAKTLAQLAKKGGRYAYIFEFESTLCKTLSLKSKLIFAIKEHYDRKDLDALKKDACEIDDLIASLNELHAAYRAYWLKFNKSYGFELFDYRLGGAATRAKTVQSVLCEYIEGKSERIAELEEERLPFLSTCDGKVIAYTGWEDLAIGRKMRI